MEIAYTEKYAVSVLARVTYSFRLFREITIICCGFSQMLSLSFCVIRDGHLLEGGQSRQRFGLAFLSPLPVPPRSQNSSISVALTTLMVSGQSQGLKQEQPHGI